MAYHLMLFDLKLIEQRHMTVQNCQSESQIAPHPFTGASVKQYNSISC